MKELGFQIALCGHQHAGFHVLNREPPERPVLHVLSAGAATLGTARLRKWWHRSTVNQFGVYDFLVDPDDPTRVKVELCSLEYDLYNPSHTSFDEHSELDPFFVTL